VINQQLGDRHDILLGIMGARFGTPTGRASSGTEEEFDRVLKRHEVAPGSVQIMMYFKDVEVHRDKHSLLQAIKVEEFRERLEKAGVLYKTFKDNQHFANLIDVDLPLCLRDRFSTVTREGQQAVAALPTIKDEEKHHSEESAEEDLGYLDYIELFQDSMGRLGSFATSVSQEMMNFNERTKARTEELRECKLPNGNTDIKRAKIVTNKAAGDHDEFANIISHYVEMLSRESQKAVDSFHGMLAVVADFQHPSDEEKKRASEDIERFLDAVREAGQAVLVFKKTMESMPRMTSKFNKAKKI
jgi:hypothetical protein